MVFALSNQSSTAMTDSYTLSDVVKLTGAKPRTIQYWSLNGVIQCDPETQHSGPGSPRQYSEDEVVIAMIINGVARMPLMIGALKDISNKIREMIQYGHKKKFKSFNMSFGLKGCLPPCIKTMTLNEKSKTLWIIF